MIDSNAKLRSIQMPFCMQSHVASQEKATDPEIASLSDRISRLEHQLAAEKKTDYSTFPEI
ncbi:hypothetical protein HVW19_20795 [Escherichia coli]|nr:hypothetical protein [Escherichia coli]